jgi:hypothetical protein
MELSRDSGCSVKFDHPEPRGLAANRNYDKPSSRNRGSRFAARSPASGLPGRPTRPCGAAYALRRGPAGPLARAGRPPGWRRRGLPRGCAGRAELLLALLLPALEPAEEDLQEGGASSEGGEAAMALGRQSGRSGIDRAGPTRNPAPLTSASGPSKGSQRPRYAIEPTRLVFNALRETSGGLDWNSEHLERLRAPLIRAPLQWIESECTRFEFDSNRLDSGRLVFNSSPVD